MHSSNYNSSNTTLTRFLFLQNPHHPDTRYFILLQSLDTVDLSSVQRLKLVDVERFATGLVWLAPLHLDRDRSFAQRVKAEGKDLSIVLPVAHQLLYDEIRKSVSKWFD